MKVYLDNAATTKVDERVLKKMLPYFSEKYGNASSVHSKGIEAKIALDDSRKICAKFLGCKFDEIIFTSGGTESNNMVLRGLGKITDKKEIITSVIEHPAILETCADLAKQGYKIKYLKVDSNGFIDLNELKNMISSDTCLVSVMHANNEIGIINDINAIGKICHDNGVLFHTDAVQSICKTKINLKNVDFLSASSHKIHGPKGVGLLYISNYLNLKPLITGGGQEKGLRSGTYNTHGIIGFAEAIRLFGSKEIKKMSKLRDKLIKGILEIKGTKLNGVSGDKRLCNNVNVSILGCEGEAVGAYLDSKGICISTGSACSSHSLKPSHVLGAIGLSNEEVNTSIRISLSKFTTEQEIDYVIKTLKKVVEKVRKISGWKANL